MIGDEGLEAGVMMDDGPSVALFIVAVIGVSILAAVGLPTILRRLPLRRGVPALALVGPVLGLVGGLVGTVAMILSGHDIWYALVVAFATGAASIIVGLRLAGPLARDLDRVSNTVLSVADGARQVRTEVDSGGEVGALAEAVDELSRSLARAEVERSAAENERRSVVSALSHDLRTPLASLLVSVDALEDEIGEPEDHIRAMRGNVMALEALVGDLFLLARADSGTLGLSLEPLDLAELVDEAVEAVEPVASLTEVTVEAELTGSIEVDADHHALGRVLRNLLDNAIRYSPTGGTVTIVDTSDETGARIEVIDQGTGFPDSFVPQVFERFTQADDARSRPGGAGLGLAIARTLLAAHQGSISIKPGPGGRVEIELPRLDRTGPPTRDDGGSHPGEGGDRHQPDAPDHPRTGQAPIRRR
jgi:signal transduction histidine kinase